MLLAKHPVVEDVYPLSPLQEGLLFHTLYQPASGVYVTQLSWRFHGSLHMQAFEQAWQQIIERHAILRTTFRWDGKRYLQVVLQQVSIPFQVLDWRGLSHQEQLAQRAVVRQEDRIQGFDTSAAPLLRLTLAYEDEDRVYVLWSNHHLVLWLVCAVAPE